jgi:hypothetical protein
MTTLNLLPPQEQKNVTYSITWQALKIIIGLAIIFSAIILIIFIGTNILTQKYAQDISSPLQLEKNLTGKTAATDYNQELQALTGIQNDSLLWSQILVSLSNIIPTTISITNVNIDYKKNTFQLEGIAPDRQTSLVLIKNIENITWLKNINAPLTNLLTRTNIKFVITAELDTAKLPRL